MYLFTCLTRATVQSELAAGLSELDGYTAVMSALKRKLRDHAFKSVEFNSINSNSV